MWKYEKMVLIGLLSDHDQSINTHARATCLRGDVCGVLGRRVAQRTEGRRRHAQRVKVLRRATRDGQ
jgi:hypothetical protein